MKLSDKDREEIINFTISVRILLAIKEGRNIREAFDRVIGKGAYDRLAGEVYNRLTS